MDNRQNLQEYLSQFRTVSEKRKIYFFISRSMHRYHNDGEYIVHLNFRNIRICFTNNTDVLFSNYQKIGFRPIEETIEMKFKNIVELAQLMVCSYIEYDFKNPVICLEVLEKELEKLESVFHPDDFKYLKKVLILKEFVYYDDYISRLENPNVPVFQEKKLISEGEQAFTSYFLLIINITVIIMLFASILLYLY